MKRYFLIFSMALLLGGLTISFISRDSGYVLIVFGNTSVETSFWFGLLMLLVLAYASLLLIRLSIKIRLFIKEQKVTQQKKFTRRGVLAFTKGQWGDAVDSLLQAAPAAGASFANYLMAARAANEMGNWEKVQLILEKAQQVDPKAQTAIELARAEMLMDNKQWHEAQIILEGLKAHNARHRLVLSLLRTVYLQTGQWEILRQHIDRLHRSKLFDVTQLQAWEEETLEAILTVAVDDPDLTTHPIQYLQECWAKLPKTSQQNIVLVLRYAKGLKRFGADNQVEPLIRRQLKEGWSDELALLYGQVLGSDIDRQLSTAEIWLESHPNSASLLLSLGRLARRNQAWDKAKYYLERSLNLEEKAETQLELGQLLIAMNDIERGKKLLGQGVEKLSGITALPLP